MRAVAGAAILMVLAACGPDRGSGGPHGLADLSQGPVIDFSEVPDLALLIEPVHVVLTADNAYAFGWGDALGVSSLKGRPPTATAGDIFNCPVGTGPEAYDVPAAESPPDGYLYVVTWDDEAVTEGVI